LSRAPPGSLAFNSSRVAGLSSEPSPGSIETADWQRTSRPQSPAPQPGFISPPHSFSSGDWRTHSTTCTILIQTLSTSTVWELIRKGRLITTKSGRRRMVVVDSYRTLISELKALPRQDARRNNIVPALGSGRRLRRPRKSDPALTTPTK
jgi:hypothetical protein